MNTLTFEIRGRKATVRVPSSWNELSLSQIEAIAEILSKTILPSEVKLRVLMALIGVRRTWFPTRAQRYFKRYMNQIEAARKARDYAAIKQINDELADLLQLTEFVFKENTLTRNPLPSLSVVTKALTGPVWAPFVLPLRRKKLVGIQGDFSSLTVGEFDQSNKHYIEYCKDKRISHLATIAAIIYRPVVKGKRVLFAIAVDQLYDYEAIAPSILKHISRTKLLAIASWYSACHHATTTANPHIFPPPPDEKIKDFIVEKPAATNGWLDIVLEMCGSQLGDFLNVYRTQMGLFLIHTRRIYEKADKQKRDLEKLRRK